MYLKFWIKTIYYYYFPYRIGHLEKFKDPNSELDDEIGSAQNDNDIPDWEETEADDLVYRRYDDYDEYKKHQGRKYAGIIKKDGGFTKRTIANFRKRFFRRFRHLPKYLSKSADILCLGARQGTEVEVLRDIGFKNAYGIDLNPGPKNKFVKKGDFMNLENPDSSLDMIYSNALDHAYNLEAFFAEHARALKPDGYALYDITLGGKGNYEVVKWESTEAIISLLLKNFKTVIKEETETSWKWVLLQGKKS